MSAADKLRFLTVIEVVRGWHVYPVLHTRLLMTGHRPTDLYQEEWLSRKTVDLLLPRGR